MSAAADIAERNFAEHIAGNTYPGRGFVVGAASDKSFAIVYFIMGRSEHSRNRRFVVEGGSMRTEPVDASLVDDPSLIIYDAMLELPAMQFVTNGDHTRTLYEHLEKGDSFEAALATREREPDAPNYTPRISAMLDLRSDQPELSLSILKANSSDPALTDRTLFRPCLPPTGLGLSLTTYSGDGNPLPPFEGGPMLMPLEPAPRETLDRYWDALDEGNRVSLAVKRIPTDGAPSEILVRNRHGD